MTFSDTIAKSIYSIIWPVQVPNLTRDRPMRILALGLSRSGTDSLRKALYELNYGEIYHAYYLHAQGSRDGPFWLPLIWKKNRGEKVQLSTEDYDRVLGNIEVITDMPGYMFAEELMDAYPDAQVIINRRQDTEKWHQSLIETQSYHMKSWYLFWASVFSPRLWWLYWAWYHCELTYFNGDIPKYGIEVEKRHYARLEELCKERNRSYLKWDVIEGWEPLCKYINKPVPDKPFPRGNARGSEYTEIQAKQLAELFGNADRNMWLFGTLVAILAIVGPSWYFAPKAVSY